ncbi:hypothetical protein [Streptomyces sp. NPDC093591]|uniref:hypothetical protein n=1 Tax=Streptomyces sp. NPDC093591 TaxID=3366044 RepID=UPI0037F9C6E5
MPRLELGILAAFDLMALGVRAYVDAVTAVRQETLRAPGQMPQSGEQRSRLACLAIDVPAGDHRFHVLAVGDWTVFDGAHTPQLRLFVDDQRQIAYDHSDVEANGSTPSSCRYICTTTSSSRSMYVPFPVGRYCAVRSASRSAQEYPDGCHTLSAPEHLPAASRGVVPCELLMSWCPTFSWAAGNT